MLRKKRKSIKIKPALAGGFRDYRPEDAIIRGNMLAKIRKTFENFGFDPIETPAVERTEVLLKGEAESDKIIYRLNPASRDVRYPKKDELSLRFDLTVPLARFIAANPEIPKPFRRYQIGKVWRGESPQAGRYREFIQADADIVGSSSSEAEAEIIMLAAKIFENLGINNFVIKVNSRQILNELPLYAGFSVKKLPQVLRALDKKDKLGENGVKKELAKFISEKSIRKIFKFLKEAAAASENAKKLEHLLDLLNAAGVAKKNLAVDYFTVRGLGYYTGTIFEIVLTNLPALGSVASGGRYDTLTIPFTGQILPSVGFSLGVDRLFAALDELGVLKKKKTATEVLILNLEYKLTKDYLKFAEELRNANINTALYLGDDRAFQAQLAYAIKKEIPYVIIYGKREQSIGKVTVKNIISREQKEIPKEKILEFFSNSPRSSMDRAAVF